MEPLTGFEPALHRLKGDCPTLDDSGGMVGAQRIELCSVRFVGPVPSPDDLTPKWSERLDSNQRLHASRACRLATDLLSVGIPGRIRTVTPDLGGPVPSIGGDNWSE